MISTVKRHFSQQRFRRVQSQVWGHNRHRICTTLRLPCGDHRQQWGPLCRVCPKSHPFCGALLPAKNPADIFTEHHGIHGTVQIEILLTWDFDMKCFVVLSSGWSWRRSWGSRQTWCQIGNSCGLRQGSEADTPHWWLIWGGQLRNVRESLWVRLYLVKQQTYFPGFRQAKAFNRSNLLHA